jgi:serine/threonine protein kinase/Tol biopolymer transport system component
MTPERWIRAQELYFAAAEREAGSRAAFLEEACRGDPELRKEVESLLSTSREAPSGFLESPAIDALPALSPTEKAGSRSIRKGTRLGPYEILAPLGSGGMGEVYRARDERLGREVAIKVLSGQLAADSDRLRRFEKEARSASALNHPNIVTIHDVGSFEGIAYIAMEKVDGQTLRELVKGPLAIKRLLPIAAQVADGLAKAHEAGIVHRDLKPENVMVTKEGLVKILDFGLAKLTAKDSGSGEGAKLPAMTGTTPGVIMGTVGYMSPEQANGATVDARSDQFSLGSILYEMATGERAFQGKTPIDVLGAIVNDEPKPIAALNPRVPAPLRWTVERCLAKEPGNRYASTEDLARELATVRAHLSEATSGFEASLGITRAPRRRLGWIGAGAALLLAAAIGYLFAIKSPGAKAPRYTQITFRRGGITGARFTPDGQSVVYSASWEGKPLELYSIRLGNPESVPLGLPPAHLLSISRNGDMAILMDPVDRGPFYLGTLARAPLGGGAPRQISRSVSDADWGPDGQLALLRMTDESTQVLEYPAGNVLYRIQNPRDHPSGAAAPWMQSPRVSPDGRLVAFIEHPLWNESAGAIAVVDLSGRKRVISAGWDGVGSPAGWDGAGSLDWSSRGDELWFTAEGRADAPGFAIRAVNLSGKDRVVLSGPGRFGLRDLSPDGRLLMERGTLRSTTLFGGQGLERERDLSWSDVSGVVGLTADGKTLLFSSGGRDNGVYLRGTDGGPVAHLGEAIPTGLSPDGKWVSTKAEGSEVLTLIPTGPGEPTVLSLPGLDDVFAQFPRWFPDSKHLIVSARRGKEGRRCFLVDFEGGAPRPVTPEESKVAWGFDGWPSPDGKWVTAGEEDDTLVLFPIGSGEPRRVRGLAPNDKFIQWSEDGRWLYIRTLSHEWPMRVYRFDLETGRRELWKEIMPRDSAGIEEPNGGAIRITPDGKSYAFSVANSLSELYVVDRVR